MLDHCDGGVLSGITEAVYFVAPFISLRSSLFGHSHSVYPLMRVEARGSRPSRTFVLTLWNERVLFSLSFTGAGPSFALPPQSN